MRRYYIYAFLSGLQFHFTTWLAFVLARGGNPGWAESAFHLAILLGEVPTGAVADLMGRRTSMLVGLLLGGLVSMSYLFIQGTLTACLVLALSGLAGTFLSGADTALIFETAEAKGGSEYARKVLARVSALRLGGMAVSPVIAGFLFQWHDWAPFAGRLIVALVTAAVVWGMVENRPSEHKERISVWQQAGLAIRAVAAHRPALILMLFGWLYYTSIAMVTQFGQAFFPSTGLTMGLTGTVFSIGLLLTTGGSTLAERLTGAGAGRIFRFAPLALGLGYLGMGLGGMRPGGLFLVLPAYFVAAAFDGMLDPIYQHRFNEAIPSAQRATILSLQSAGFSMLMSVSFPAAAYLHPVSLIYQAVGGVVIVLALIWMARRWSY